jgi:hypothetical protein
MKPKLFVRSPSLPGLELESIDERHLEVLRQAKNANANRFFHQEEISPEGQLHWYRAYCLRPLDWIFVVRHLGADVACIGYRMEEAGVDIYNLLRFPGAGGDPYAVARALDLLCTYVASITSLPIRGRVLASNPALGWLIKRGFARVGGGERDGLAFQLIELNLSRLVRYPLSVESSGQGAAI